MRNLSGHGAEQWNVASERTPSSCRYWYAARKSHSSIFLNCKGLPGCIRGFTKGNAPVIRIENLRQTSAVLESTKTPLEASVVRKNYTKLLKKRNSYQSYFEKNLKCIDLALKKVLIRSSIRVTRPSPVFREDASSERARILKVIPSKVVLDTKVIKERGRKEREILKKYASKVLEQRKKSLQDQKDKEYIRKGRRWYNRRRKELEIQSVEQSVEVLRAAARAIGVESEPEVVRHLGAQIRPPAELVVDNGWFAAPELVTEPEVRNAMSNLGIGRVSYTPYRAIGPGSNRSDFTRNSFCASCPYVGDGSPGECPNCGARLNVYYKKGGSRKKKRGSGRQMPR